MQFDSETGLYHTWFRQYDPSQGRWLSVDPLPGHSTDPQSLNRYVYVRNDPVNASDRLGLCTCEWWAWYWVTFDKDGNIESLELIEGTEFLVCTGCPQGEGGGGSGPVGGTPQGGVDPDKDRQEAISRINGRCLEFLLRVINNLFSQRAMGPLTPQDYQALQNAATQESIIRALERMKFKWTTATEGFAAFVPFPPSDTVRLHPARYARIADRPALLIHEAFHTLSAPGGAWTDYALSAAIGKPVRNDGTAQSRALASNNFSAAVRANCGPQ